MNHRTRYEIRRIRELLGWKAAAILFLAYALRRLAVWYRFKFRFVSVPFALLCALCAFLSVGCSHDQDSASSDRSQGRHHHGTSGGAQGQNDHSGFFNSPSATPIPGT